MRVTTAIVAATAMVLGLVVAASSAPRTGAASSSGAAGLAGSSLELPFLHPGTANGSGKVEREAKPARPASHVVDGQTGDWVGTATGFGGTAAYSRGEYVYTDHIFDACGADDGKDVDRDANLDPLAEAVPETYRLEPIFQANLPGEFGFPAPDALAAEEQYGDADLQDVADLTEVRVAADPGYVYVLARTTTMRSQSDTALLLLVESGKAKGQGNGQGQAGKGSSQAVAQSAEEGAAAGVVNDVPREVPFNSGILTRRADVAVLLAAGAGRAVDLVTGVETPINVAVNPSGWTNAIEAALPRSLLESKNHKLSIALGAGRFDPVSRGFAALAGLAANLANVAFRTSEPVRVWFDKQQAFALYDRTIDPFFAEVDTKNLDRGINEVYRPGPGYHDRIFTSSETISSESSRNGILQHYGLYLPSSYKEGTPVPAAFWMHWRGGEAHSAATMSPRILRDLGEGLNGVVVSPRGRGSSSWYVGKGMADVLQVWDDVFRTVSIDPDRVYVAGHSMGGWASWLFSTLYPDKFAAAYPVEGPLTQGAWTGADFEGCDDYRYDDYSFCYVQANGGDARTQHTLKLLPNLRNVPMAIYQGVIDELVPVTGVTLQVEELRELGYRYRYYLFPTYEHYTHPVLDEWAEGVRYLAGFRRDANPPRVTYVRDMPFERTVETGPSQENPFVGLSFDFDHAYWMSELTPKDGQSGRATFDGRSLAIPEAPVLVLPEAGGPASIGQVGPYVMTGQTWMADPLATTPTLSNGFEVTVSGTSRVLLDLARMRISTAKTITGSVTTDSAMTLRLSGNWASAPAVRVGGSVVTATLEGGVLSVQLSAGTSQVVIG
ncbi:MAG: prolyl oligopeptidase family serine peptidase [Actinomycetota bacterium]